MSVIPLVVTGLKVLAWVWSLITFAVAASFIAEANDIFGRQFVNETTLTAGNAIIAAGISCWLYLTAVLIITFLAPNNIFISVMLDTVFLSIFFVFFLGAVAALSTLANNFSNYHSFKVARLGSATVGLGWVMTCLLLGILIFVVVYTLTHFGRAYATWRTPFNQLVTFGPSIVAKDTEGRTPQSVPMGSVPTTHQGTAPATGANNVEQAPSQPGVSPYPATSLAPAHTSVGGKAINRI